jgi:hypothetical protein
MPSWNLQASAGAVGASLLWRGTWSSGLSYNPNDGVARNGSSYIALTNNTNKPPETNPSDWGILAQGIPSSKVVIGDTAQGDNPPNSIIIPSFVNHPDRIFTSPNAFDDHFEGTSLNAKWTQIITPGTLDVITSVSDSKLSLGGYSPNSADGVIYSNQIWQPVPNTDDFSITVSFDAMIWGREAANSQGFIDFRLYNSTSNIGVGTRFKSRYNSTTPATGDQAMSAHGGTSIATLLFTAYAPLFPKYARLVWTLSSKLVSCQVSNDGRAFQAWMNITSAQSGFTASVLPQRFYTLIGLVNAGSGVGHFDWVRFTNP